MYTYVEGFSVGLRVQSGNNVYVYLHSAVTDYKDEGMRIYTYTRGYIPVPSPQGVWSSR